MRILFACDEGERETAIDHGEVACASSLFFCSELPPKDVWGHYDAVVIGATSLLSDPPGASPVVVVASGPASLASACFEAGCTDYIREPWTESELIARVRARTCPAAIRFAGEGGCVAESGSPPRGADPAASISESSLRLLSLLEANSPRPVPREAIAALFSLGTDRSRAVDMRVARLRESLRKAGSPMLADSIHCVDGSYYFAPDARTTSD